MKIANYKLLKGNYFNKNLFSKYQKITYLLNNEIANFIYLFIIS